MSHPKEPSPTWGYSDRSDVHIAIDKFWFGCDYTPFDSFVLFKRHTDKPAEKIPVIGFGTVVLPIKSFDPAFLEEYGEEECYHEELLLRKVLHCPDFAHNIIGNPTWEEEKVLEGQMSAAEIRKKYEKIVMEDSSQIGIIIAPPLDRDPRLWWLYSYQLHFLDAELKRLDRTALYNNSLTRRSSQSKRHHLSEAEEDLLADYGIYFSNKKHRWEGFAILHAMRLKKHKKSKKRTFSAIHSDLGCSEGLKALKLD
ncbi:hypothetical protein N7456_006540 [Penicillium angulare]|uniref:Uncharacterized protein n=1 Tax=Penicillium angulare TaxID=116970 RepID=A0A9W9FI20_9EURO|nr:hypothetical protein N7456_006540 [Penicillium angulare]